MRALLSYLSRTAKRRSFRKRLQGFKTFLKYTEPVNLNLERRKALVVAPHPDDEVIGCGGTLRLISNKGGVFDVVYLTKGEKGFRDSDPALAEILIRKRVDEAYKAGGILGVRSIYFFQGTEGELWQNNTISAELCLLLKKEKYDLIFAPWFFDAHLDHSAAYAILRRALRADRNNIEVALYEVWSPLIANALVDISATFPVKIQAIAAYETQTEQFDYLGFVTHLNKYRRYGLFSDASVAEGFLVCGKELVCRFGV